MAVRDQDDLPYRSPVTPKAQSVPVSKDETSYDTIKNVHTIFLDALEGLYKNFNAFDVLKAGTDEAVRDEMMRNIAGNQKAFDILSPLVERMENAMAEADSNFKKRNS